MAHVRNRHILNLLKNYGTFWPVVGVLGLRQSGKSTLFRDFLKAGTYVTLDDEDAQEDAKLSSKNFLQKLSKPVMIDEVQRVPALFDSIKLFVDQKKRPGTFYLTGSSQFSTKLGIRESLTGRMGILYFYPLTLSEAYKMPFDPRRSAPLHKFTERLTVEDALKSLESGCLPVPFFTRKSSLVKNYFQSWMETTLLRDAAKAYGKGYDSDLAHALVREMGSALKEGEYPSLKHFKEDSRRVRRYMQAFEDIFLVQKITSSPVGVGNDLWTFSDSGISAYVCGSFLGEGTQLSLIRSFILKEVKALTEYSEKRLRLEYFKTSRSAPVDFIWDGIPVKISVAPLNQLEYDMRPLRAAMKKLNSKKGILMTGRSETEIVDGISIVSWVHYS